MLNVTDADWLPGWPLHCSRKTKWHSSLVQRYNELKFLMGEVPVHQIVMKTNFKTEGSDEKL